MLALFRIAVAEDDGVVYGERQLQDDGDGVCDIGDSPKPVVRTHVEERRRPKGDEQHRYFHIGVGGEEQHRHYDEDGDAEHDDHLGLYGLLKRVSHLGAYVAVVAGEERLYLVHGGFADGGGRIPVEGDGKEGGCVFIVVLRGVELHGVDSVHGLEPGQQLFRSLVGDAGDHDVRRGKGGEFGLHDVQAAPCLRVFGEVARDIVIHVDPIAGKNAKNGQDGKEQKEQGLSVHDHRRDLLHERASAPLFHTPTPRKAHDAA